MPSGETSGMLANKKVDLDVVPQLNGVPLPDVDLESLDKPWQKPGQYDLLLPLLSLPLSLSLSLPQHNVQY